MGLFSSKPTASPMEMAELIYKFVFPHGDMDKALYCLLKDWKFDGELDPDDWAMELFAFRFFISFVALKQCFGYGTRKFNAIIVSRISILDEKQNVDETTKDILNYISKDGFGGYMETMGLFEDNQGSMEIDEATLYGMAFTAHFEDHATNTELTRFSENYYRKTLKSLCNDFRSYKVVV